MSTAFNASDLHPIRSRMEGDFMQYSTTESVIQSVSLSIIMLSAIAGNLIIILVVAQNDSMRTPRYMFILNLSCGDLGVALLSMPFSLVTAISRDWILGQNLCKLHGFFGSLFFCVSIFTLTVMSTDKYFSLVKPLERIITMRRAKLINVSVWITSSLISAGPLLNWGHFVYNSSTLACGTGYPRNISDKLYLMLLVVIAYFSPLIVMSWVYWRILRTVHKHTKLALQLTGSAVMNLQRRITFTLIIVLCIFLCCWAPFVTLIALANISGSVSELPRGLGVVAYWCGFLNSALNPVIFFARNNKFYEGFKELCCNIRDAFICNKSEFFEAERRTRKYTHKRSVHMNLT